MMQFRVVTPSGATMVDVIDGIAAFRHGVELNDGSAEGVVVQGPFDYLTRGRFDGDTFEADKDADRLRRQLLAVRAYMADGKWHTLADIGRGVEAPEASVSARLRDMRKPKFGGHTIARRRTNVSNGTFEYRWVTKP
jgi:hypothetical protein